MKVAIFDFCKTLVSVNSLPLFVDFVLQNSRNRFVYHIKRNILKNKKFISRFLNIKSRYIEIYVLKGYEKKFINEISKLFFNNIINNYQNEIVIKNLFELKKNGYFVLILSAALDVYLKYVKEVLPIDYVICAELMFENNLCKGKIKGIDPYGKNKIKKLKSDFPYFENIDWQASYYFTDDYITEIDILNRVGNPYIVLEKNKEIDFINPKFKVLKV